MLIVITVLMPKRRSRYFIDRKSAYLSPE